MCAPAAIGAVSAVTGIVGGIAQHSQANKAAKAQNSAQNAANEDAYKAQQEAIARENEQAMQNYYLAKQQQEEGEKQYAKQIRLNTVAASRASVSAQMDLNAKYRQAATEAADDLAASMRAQGTVRASGRTGQSVRAILLDADREYHRNLGVMAVNLGYSNMDYANSVQSIFEAQVTANNQAHSQRKVTPIKPKNVKGPAAPKKSNIKGPGAASLLGSVVSSGLQGYDTYKSLTAPKATK
jgi:hypothetical protein